MKTYDTQCQRNRRGDTRTHDTCTTPPTVYREIHWNVIRFTQKIFGRLCRSSRGSAARAEAQSGRPCSGLARITCSLLGPRASSLELYRSTCSRIVALRGIYYTYLAKYSNPASSPPRRHDFSTILAASFLYCECIQLYTCTPQVARFSRRAFHWRTGRSSATVVRAGGLCELPCADREP